MLITTKQLAHRVLGTCMSPTDLQELGESFGLKDGKAAVDLQVALICEKEGVYQCNTCGWWSEEEDIYSIDLCTDCYEENK